MPPEITIPHKLIFNELTAGAPTVVASLWRVNDQATSSLMTRFHRHLQGGLDKAEALCQAQLETLADYPEPYRWAAFVLSGDSGSLGRKG